MQIQSKKKKSKCCQKCSERFHRKYDNHIHYWCYVTCQSISVDSKCLEREGSKLWSLACVYIEANCKIMMANRKLYFWKRLHLPCGWACTGYFVKRLFSDIEFCESSLNGLIFSLGSLLRYDLFYLSLLLLETLIDFVV